MGLDILLFREEKGGNPQLARDSEKKRFRDPVLVDKVIALDNQWRQKRAQLDDLNKARNVLSKEIGQLMKQKKGEDAEEKKKQVLDIKKQSEIVEKEIEQAEKDRDTLLLTVGNIVHASVPVHDNEDFNEVVGTYGNFEKSDKYQHHELLHMIGGYEAKRGVNVLGHRGYYFRGPGLMISLACMNYGLAFLMKKGYVPMQPPYMMKKEVMSKVAQLSQFDEELYHVGDGETGRYLIATSEQPLCALHQGEWIDESLLKEPIRYAGYSTCFRKEAGAAGKDNRGIFRVHQFDKVEQFCLTKPEDSWQELERMVKTSEEFYQSLGIPYRLVAIVSGALNDAASKKIDLEGWFPAQGEKDNRGTFRELVSCSNCTDYQSRPLGIRCGAGKAQDEKEKRYVHLLNGTLCANTRTVCALLENHQQEDGIQLPEILFPFLPEFVPGRPGFIPFVNPPPPQEKEEQKK